MHFTDTVIFVTLFAAVFLSWFFYLKFRNSERLALIEKGSDIDFGKKKKYGFPWLKIGFIFTGIGVGIFIGTILMYSNISVFQQKDSVMFFSMFIFGGIGTILAAKYDKPKTEIN